MITASLTIFNSMYLSKSLKHKNSGDKSLTQNVMPYPRSENPCFYIPSRNINMFRGSETPVSF